MPIPVSGQVGEQVINKGVTSQPLRQGGLADLIVSGCQGRYYEMARNQRIFCAQAIVTAPVIFSTAAGTGGPFLWNGTSSVVGVILAVGIGVTVVTTVAAALGITGNTGQTIAPTATTAIDSQRCTYLGGPPPAINAYRVGTPSVAGNFLLPLAQLHTGALTVDNVGMGWIDIGGAVIVPPGCWASLAASATATTTVAQLGMMWAEVPL